MDAVLPLTDSEDPDHLIIAYHPRQARDAEEEESGDDDSSPCVPYFPFGVIFLRRIVLKNLPRMRAGGRSLTPAAFKYIFDATESMIEHNYYQVGIIPEDALAENRLVTNKSKRTPTFIPEPGTTQPILFHLAEHGHELPARPIDSGSDMDMDNVEDNEEDIDTTITHLFRQFLIDIMNKVPNPRGVENPSYCTLDREERLSVTEDLFMNRQLAGVWRRCQYKSASSKDFIHAFHHLFPPLGHKTGKVQNYRQCRYYIKWKEICHTADEKTVNIIRLEIRKRVMKFAWLPHASQDKMWPTKHLTGFVHYPLGSDGAAPRILLRGRPEV
jgi:hypothetical protein